MSRKSVIVYVLLFSLTLVADSGKLAETIEAPANIQQTGSTERLNQASLDLSQLPPADCPGVQIAGINRDDRTLLNRTTWTELPGMTVSCSNTDDNPVLVNFSASLTDRVSNYYGGLVELRLTRDGDQIATKEVGFAFSPLFNDMSASISHTDAPAPGEHVYKIEYRINNSGYRAFANERNLQIYTK